MLIGEGGLDEELIAADRKPEPLNPLPFVRILIREIHRDFSFSFDSSLCSLVLYFSFSLVSSRGR